MMSEPSGNFFSRLFRSLFFPKKNKFYWIRVAVVALAAFLFFKFLCKPVYLNGESMEPNFHTMSFNFCWTPTFFFRKPARGDVAVLAYEGDKVMLLKRIIGLPGEVLEIRAGTVYINGTALEEPYVKFPRAKWDLPPRRIPQDCIYVIGDNRSMPMHAHKFGAIRKKRLMGTLLL